MEPSGSNPKPYSELKSEFPPIICGDQLHYQHGSEGTIICLSPAHPVVRTHAKVKAVRFSKTHLQVNRSHRIVAGEKMCEVETEDGTVHVLNFDHDGLLLEVNLNLLKNPDSIHKPSSYEGYLVIVRYGSDCFGDFAYINVSSVK